MTKDEAIAILTKEIKRWKGNGWNVAADFLQHFINPSNGNLYEVPEALRGEVITESEPMIRKAIVLGIKEKGLMTAANFRAAIAAGKTIDMAFGKDRVRWVSTPGEYLPTYIYRLLNDRIRDTNNPLFYAFGGADLTITGTIMNLKWVPLSWPAQSLPVCGHFTYDVDAKVRIDDQYAFDPGIRENDPRHEAAVFLSSQPRRYKPFGTTISFNKTYTQFVFYVDGSDNPTAPLSFWPPEP